MVRITIAVITLMLSAGTAMAQGDVALGQQIFEERCASCHALGDAAKNGPDLANLIDRPAASIEGFNYSDAMVEAGQAGVIWDIATLHQFITKPRSVVNGSTMSFTGLRNPADVDAVIAYLATFSPTPAQ